MAGGMGLSDSDLPLIEQHDAVFLDLDGVVYAGDHAIEGAPEVVRFVTEAGLPVVFLTNNASRPASAVAEHLTDLGLGSIAQEQVVTAAQAIAHVMAGDLEPGAKVLLVGGAGLRVPLEEAGLTCVDSATDDPVAVVQGFHPDLGWKHLAEAAYAISAGARWYASNSDLTFPSGRGLAPGNGSLIQAVANATGATPIVAGKPHRPVFNEAIARFGCAHPIMVGDRIDTDIIGAIDAGITVLAVLSGVNTLDDYLALGPGQRPDFIAADLRGLLAPHPAVKPGEDSLRARVAEAWDMGR